VLNLVGYIMGVWGILVHRSSGHASGGFMLSKGVQGFVPLPGTVR
jgi:hypothetical protein